MNNLHSNALLQSIKDAPLLVGALPEAASLDRALLGMPTSGMRLNTNQKLGHLYEDALRLLLSESDQLELLADHVQVFDRKQITLGEMDYILRAVRTQQVFQLELAVKFYLGVPTADGWQFPGPDPHDNWQRKLQHMRTHQLPLAQRPEAMSLLRERWGCERVKVRQLIYGCIFYPMGVAEFPLPESVRADCRKGCWLYAQDWERFFAGISEVCMVPKPLWPVEMTAALRESLPRVSVSALHAASAQRCVMFVLPDAEEPHFLVPNHWPG
tara:strand:+ start:159 stop:968 length:810 start_codon:yes stop_codon:yes gene_type:complete